MLYSNKIQAAYFAQFDVWPSTKNDHGHIYWLPTPMHTILYQTVISLWVCRKAAAAGEAPDVVDTDHCKWDYVAHC